MTEEGKKAVNPFKNYYVRKGRTKTNVENKQPKQNSI